jgi:hypothetical protein
MARRRFLGAIDALIGAQIEVERLIPPTTLTKINTLDTFSADTLTGLGNMGFEGGAMKPQGLEISGVGNHITLSDGNFLKLHGTDMDGVGTTFRVEIVGGVVKIVRE